MKKHLITSLDEFVLNEQQMNSSGEQEHLDEKRITTKRRYTDSHPEKRGYSNASVRNSILEFLEKHEEVSEVKMQQFIAQLEESRGKTVNRNWFNDNTKYVKRTMNEAGERVYKLTEYGRKVFSKTRLVEDGESMATLDNTEGMGEVEPPTKDKVGSGDRFGSSLKKRKQSLERAKRVTH